ncbi:MAG TPA: SDR family oxidoreductase [Candidatus Paceibacterota bacterium]|nr:SDR family oxidoreductase [Verrucomicrobiota bacterium]HSA10700.1 SDR family oxidoreductase [Candidatus Paceibacterota bacterium]
MIPLRGMIAIITGASRGIGLAIARALAREGVRLGLLSRSKPDVAGEFVACDLAELEEIPSAARELVARLGTVDFLINNAGTFLEKQVPDIQLADWERVQRVNLTAPFLLTREVLPGMIARRQGRIINIASTASTQGYPQQSAYCASKHGLLGFGRSLAVEVKPHNIHVHTLCPGGVDTDFIKGTRLGERLEGQPKINPEDVAEMVLFLLHQPGNIDLAEVIIRRFDPKPPS